MMIQYSYAVLTMLPCPLWFYSRWASAGFMMVVFTWSVYNGSTYYIDVFGKRFQKELESLKSEVAKWQSTPDMATQSPLLTPQAAPTDSEAQAEGDYCPKELGVLDPETNAESKDGTATRRGVDVEDPASGGHLDVNDIPLLDAQSGKSGANGPSGAPNAVATGVSSGTGDGPRERKVGESTA